MHLVDYIKELEELKAKHGNLRICRTNGTILPATPNPKPEVQDFVECSLMKTHVEHGRTRVFRGIELIDKAVVI